MRPTFLSATLVAVFFSFGYATDASALVKESSSGICHDEGSPWFNRTKNFKGHGSMQDCLVSGRAYKGYSGEARAATGSRPASSNASTPYDRELYDHWIDDDGDCQNARHEMLISLSTGPIHLSQNGCRVLRGRWLDPYTDRIFTESSDLDIDHLVPLAWAHSHGADRWSAEQRREFANDPVNLFAVQASENRSKGAKGPLEWLPPNRSFQCQYVLRFDRIVKTYRLSYTEFEEREMSRLRERLC